jgi:3-oxoacyl-[acyl-carrier protein] reductase
MKDIALVTGGAGEIGTAIAERLTNDGFDVVVVDMRAPSHKHCVDFIEVDLGKVDDIRAKVGGYCEGKRVTRLINNAGIIKPASVEETKVEDFDTVMNVNVRSAIVLTQIVLPSMKQAGIGRIVNISSRAALGKELRPAYASSKAALIGMTKTMALELGKAGIAVNAIGPGPIRTKLFTDANPDDSPRTKAILSAIPVGFMGQPTDIAAATSFLASDDARFVTGQILYVCGGMTVGSAGA